MSCEWKHVYTCNNGNFAILFITNLLHGDLKKTGYSKGHAMDFWDSNWFLLYSDCIVFVDNQMHISKKKTPNDY